MPKNKNLLKRICIIGTGYVGLVTGVCLAEIGNKVICVDSSREKIDKLKNNILPIYEPGLEGLFIKNKKAGRLFFTTQIKEGVRNSDIIFIAVNTPTKENGETDLCYVESVAREVAGAIDKYKVIVSKSTMPVETGKKIKEAIKSFCQKDIQFDVVSNPEFLREGTAIKDFLEPDRIVLGLESKRAEEVMRALYKPIKAPIIVTNIEAAEIIKHACNAFLATKISFINAIANICEKVGADVEEVAEAMGLDKRIGRAFLNAGIGYGGACLPKDIDAFIHITCRNNYDFKLLKDVREINQAQRENFIRKVKQALWNLKGKKVGVLGLSFKPNTDDMRSAPSIEIINTLLKEGAEIKAYDPVSMEKAKDIFGQSITYCPDIYEAARDADALLVLTDWDEFKKMDLAKVKNLLRLPKIIDGRNIFNSKKMSKIGFYYYSIGRA